MDDYVDLDNYWDYDSEPEDEGWGGCILCGKAPSMSYEIWNGEFIPVCSKCFKNRKKELIENYG